MNEFMNVYTAETQQIQWRGPEPANSHECFWLLLLIKSIQHTETATSGTQDVVWQV
jgi:hypothetical protein